MVVSIDNAVDGDRQMTSQQQIKVERGATGEVRFFDSVEEARRFCMRRGDHNELWRIER